MTESARLTLTVTKIDMAGTLSEACNPNRLRRLPHGGELPRLREVVANGWTRPQHLEEHNAANVGDMASRSSQALTQM